MHQSIVIPFTDWQRKYTDYKISEAFPGLTQTSKMEGFATVSYYWKALHLRCLQWNETLFWVWHFLVFLVACANWHKTKTKKWIKSSYETWGWLFNNRLELFLRMVLAEYSQKYFRNWHLITDRPRLL